LVRRGLCEFNAQDISTTAWAFAVLDPPSSDELFGSARFTTRCTQLETAFSPVELSQLHQWSLWRVERGSVWPGLPDSFRRSCRIAFTAREGVPSQMQSNVVREIRLHAVHVKEEHRCEASGYSIDAVVTLKDGREVAVEVDGPSHFLGRSHRPTGSTLLKHRQIRYFEWRLLSVPYWEWERDKTLHWLH
jgi:hypothetical protein